MSDARVATTYVESELGKQTEVYETHDSLGTATVLLAVMLKIVEDLCARYYVDGR